MARDYKQKHYNAKQPYQRRSQMEARSEEVSSPMKWVWLMALVVTAGLLGGFFVVQHFADKGVKSGDAKVSAAKEALEKSQTEADAAETAKPQAQKVFEAVEAKPAEQEPKIHYSFYQGLANTEVVVNAEPISIELPAPYYIQAGTFTEKNAALKEQKRLAQFNQQLQVSSLQSKDKTYYRLRLGPFTDRLVMNRKRNELRKLGVDTLLIRGKAVSTPQTDQQTNQQASDKSSVQTQTTKSTATPSQH